MFPLHAVNWIMGCVCGWPLHIVIALCCVVMVRGTPVCSTTCSIGQYCSGAECQPCPLGTYQTDAVHVYLTCNPWTVKLPGSHYILVKNGTAVSDAKWRCEDGYRERQYTVGGFECVEIEATSSSTLASSTQITTTGSTHTTEATTALVLSQQQKEDLSGGEIAAVIIGSLTVIALIIIGIVIIICYKRRPRDDQPRLNFQNGGTAETFASLQSETTPLQLDSPIEWERPTLNPDNINYKFCLKFVEKLEVNKFKSFLNVLYDPSGKFRAENVLRSESSKTLDGNEYLVQSFLRWVDFNNGVYKSLIVIALDDIRRVSILKEIENLVPSFKYKDSGDNECRDTANNNERAMDAAVNEYVRALSVGNETTSSVVLRQDRFRLFYYLTDKVSIDILIKLLRQLPVSTDRFNAYNYYMGRLDLEVNYNAFAQTLEEWWQQNHDLSLKDVITEFLIYEEREDLLADRELRNRLQRIAPAETSSADSHDPEQHHCQNSSSDEMNTGRVSDSSETEHLLNDTDRAHTSNNTAGNQVSNTSEGGQLSNSSEGGQLSNTSEGGQLTNTSEGGHLSDNSEGGHLSNNSERGNLSDNADGGHLSNNADGGHLSVNNEGGHLSVNSEGGHLSVNSEGDHLSENADGGPSSNNTQGNDILNNTRVHHAPNNAQRDRGSNKNRKRQALTEL